MAHQIVTVTLNVNMCLSYKQILKDSSVLTPTNILSLASEIKGIKE